MYLYRIRGSNFRQIGRKSSVLTGVKTDSVHKCSKNNTRNDSTVKKLPNSKSKRIKASQYKTTYFIPLADIYMRTNYSSMTHY